MASGAAVRDDEAGEAAEGAARDPLSISSEVKASLSLLIVDDERTLREGCASVLQMDGYNVTTLGRGDEAVDLVRRRRFDIILVDLYMTPVTGMEILQGRPCTANKDTIVVVMTGNPSVTSKHRGAARRGLGLSAQAVLGDAPPGTRGARVARRHGGARDARPKAPAAEAERQQRQDHAARRLAGFPQGGRPRAQGGEHRRVGA